ncbi:uncharacterized protein LOC128882106 [Hylaeus volcanicus]|uniref:uncharacterized protein LOC128876163 n=1 Tax=Hylaeus volcanicus TaxID=313075 RepID=UPI0023B82F66|nr:uncharacterized protein LOC128876163 [Hylaeus volcanicus]XP_053989648.1 uncharacterized protein LOC128882106 [Hylaeus volcanicus]
MDLVYVPEVLTYGFFRNQQYRDYEQPWNKDYFHNGRSTQSHCQRVLQQHHEQKLLSKDNCHLCRESKRRSLAAYIKGKSRRSSCEEIHEEEEEQDTANNRDQKVKIDERPSKAENKTLKVSNE